MKLRLGARIYELLRAPPLLGWQNLNMFACPAAPGEQHLYTFVRVPPLPGGRIYAFVCVLPLLGLQNILYMHIFTCPAPLGWQDLCMCTCRGAHVL